MDLELKPTGRYRLLCFCVGESLCINSVFIDVTDCCNNGCSGVRDCYGRVNPRDDCAVVNGGDVGD